MAAIVPFLASALSSVISGTIAGVAISSIIANVIGAVLSLGLSMGLNALTRSKPDKPSIANRRQQLQTTVRDPVKAREIVFGKYRKGGVLTFFESVNDSTDLLMGVAMAGHEVQGIDEIYNSDELMIDQAGNVQGKYKGLVEVEKHLGTSDQEASALFLENFPGYSSTDRLRGIAYLAFKFKFDRDVFDQFPNISAVVRGAKMFDPRDGQTKYTPNAALCFAHYLNHAIYGLGAQYESEINEDMLVSAANECDEDVPVKAGKTLEFNGTDDVIDFGAIGVAITDAITIEARVRPGAVDVAAMKVLEKDTGTAGWSLQVENDKVRFITRGLSDVTLDTSAGQMVADTWKHIAAVWNPADGTKKIYVNGVLVATASSVTGSLAVSDAGSLKIGANFKGRIQDVRLWAEARTAPEIAALDDKSLTGREADLVHYWKLDEKFGKRAEDATEHVDGAITGAKWVDDESVIGSEKRYEAHGLVFSDQLPRDVIEDMLTAMGGNVVFSGGTYGIRAAAYEPPTEVFSEGDFIEGIKIQAKRSRRDLFNAVRGIYIAPENVWQSADFPPVTNATLEAEDGGVRIWQDIELPFTTSASMAQRIAYLHLLRNREQVSLTSTVTLKGLRIRAGDFCEVSNSRLGWNEKDFECQAWQFAQIGGENDEEPPGLAVRLELRETNAAIYDFNPATDEIPINPSPDSNLPSWLSPIAIVSDFVDREGFESIYEREFVGVWAGSYFGLVHNPWTGHLNAKDRTPASGNNFDIFNSYCVDPEPKAYFESPEIDIDFVDIVRTYIQLSFSKGPGQTGAVGLVKLYDEHDGSSSGSFSPAFGPAFALATADDGYDGWDSLPSTARAEGRIFKHRVELTFAPGACGYLSAFKPVIDKMTVFQKGVALDVPVGGKDITFQKRYHKMPSMSWGYRGNGLRSISFLDVRLTGFTWVGFDDNADDVGGTFDWQSAGV